LPFRRGTGVSPMGGTLRRDLIRASVGSYCLSRLDF